MEENTHDSTRCTLAACSMYYYTALPYLDAQIMYVIIYTTISLSDRLKQEKKKKWRQQEKKKHQSIDASIKK